MEGLPGGRLTPTVCPGGQPRAAGSGGGTSALRPWGNGCWSAGWPRARSTGRPSPTGAGRSAPGCVTTAASWCCVSVSRGQPWWEWPRPLARRGRLALRRLDRQEAAPLLQEALLQWQLQRQWQHLRSTPMPGACAWWVICLLRGPRQRRCLERIRRCSPWRPDGSLEEQSGVPPDYFSATGQLWGTPVYRWSLHRLTGFRWWMRRLERQLELLDLLRLDHFRALEAYWSVPGGATARERPLAPVPRRGPADMLWCAGGGSWLMQVSQLPCP
jgi:hypothetical protein